MKRLALLIVALFCVSAFAQDPPQIAVYVSGDSIYINEKKSLSTIMQSKLVNSGRYTVIERTKAFIEAIDEEHKKQRSGAIDDSQISKLGKQFGASFVCVGDITTSLGAFHVSARIIDVETAVVVAMGDEFSQLRGPEDLNVVTDKIVEKLFRGKTTSTQKSPPAPPSPVQQTSPMYQVKPPSDTGASVHFMTRPTRADIYINGRLIGTSNSGELQVPIGTHQVRFVVNNRLEMTRIMTFKPGTTQFVTLTINKDIAKPQTMPVEPMPEYNEPKWARLSNGVGVEIGGALSYSSYSASIPDDGYNPRTYSVSGFGIGPYFYIDMLFAEIFYSGGNIFKYADNSEWFVLIKYPYGNEVITIFPLFGGGSGTTTYKSHNYEDGDKVSLGGLALGGRIDVHIGKIVYLRSELLSLLSNGRAGSFKIGGGLDIGFGKNKRGYLRTELMYSLLEGKSFERENRGEMRSLEFRAGIGGRVGSGRQK